MEKPLGEFLGGELKSLRQRKGTTLEVMARKTNLSPSYISRIERGSARPSIDIIDRIFKVLGRSTSEVFVSSQQMKKPIVVLNQDQVFEDAIPLPLAKVRYLVTRDRVVEARMSVYVLEIPPRAATSDSPSSHIGEELVVVFEGQAEFCFKIGNREEVYALKGGDTIHFISSTPHMARNNSERRCRTLVVRL